MRKLLVLIFMLAVVVFVGTSCKKSKENKLTGAWTYVATSNVSNPGNNQVWTFDGTNKLKVEVKYTDTTHVYDGTYEVSSKFLKGYYIDIKGIYLYWNGLYKIEELKSNVLIMNRIEKNAESNNPEVEGGAFLWKEFTK